MHRELCRPVTPIVITNTLYFILMTRFSLLIFYFTLSLHFIPGLQSAFYTDQTENIKLQKIFHLKVVKKLYFWAFLWTKNVTKTFSSVKLFERKKQTKYLLLATKNPSILIACVQTRNNSNLINFSLTVQDFKTLFGRTLTFPVFFYLKTV